MSETAISKVTKLDDENENGAMVRLGIVHKLDPATLEHLMALQERYDANAAKRAFVEAMAGFKREAPPVIGKDKKADFGTGKAKYSYATTGAIVAAITPALSKYGLHLSWETKQEPNAVTVTCHVSHEKGHRESATLTGPRDESGGKNPIQTIGSSVHYLQRYTMVSVLGLATADMDDPDAANDRPPVAMPTPKAAPPAQPPPPASKDAPPAAPEPDGSEPPANTDPFFEGLVERVAKKENAKKAGTFRYGILIAGADWCNTFSQDFFNSAQTAKDEGRAVRIHYREGKYGRDITSMEVLGDAAGPEQTPSEPEAEAGLPF